jgi:AcrR family transcriptional regulator
MQSKVTRTRPGQTARGTLTRRAILDASIELVCEYGYAGTSVNKVCKKVGIAKTALYWHFGSKAGLMAAVLDDVTGSWITELETRSHTKGTPQERLDSMVEGLRELVEQRSHLFRIILIPVMESGTVEPELRESTRDLTDRAIKAIARGFNESAGFEIPDSDLLAHTILSLTHGALRRLLMEPTADMDRLFGDLHRTVRVLVGDRLRQLAKG